MGAQHDDSPATALHGRSVGLAFRYFRRALLLNCPVCGTRPIFLPLRRVRPLRLLTDWLTPLDGCTRCGFPYEREDGYFLFAIFGINFGLATFAAVVTYLCLDVFEFFGPVTIWTLTLAVALPIPLINFLVARHSKALWIALDHFFDPHVPRDDDGDGGWWNDDDDDGNLVRHDPPAGGGGESKKPEPVFEHAPETPDDREKARELAPV